MPLKWNEQYGLLEQTDEEHSDDEDAEQLPAEPDDDDEDSFSYRPTAPSTQPQPEVGSSLAFDERPTLIVRVPRLIRS